MTETIFTSSSWPALGRPSTSSSIQRKTWMRGSSPRMTEERPSFRGALKARTRNPDGGTVLVSGFRVRRSAPSRNDRANFWHDQHTLRSPPRKRGSRANHSDSIIVALGPRFPLRARTRRASRGDERSFACARRHNDLGPRFPPSRFEARLRFGGARSADCRSSRSVGRVAGVSGSCYSNAYTFQIAWPALTGHPSLYQPGVRRGCAGQARA